MARPRATVRDVAHRAGVHPSTVSRSLDPVQSARVRESTRRRVEEAASALGYRPDLTASSLRRRNTRTIGVLISSFSNPIYGELLHGISAQLEELGYQTLIAEVPDVPGRERMSAAIDMLQSRRIDGLICAASRGDDAPVLRELSESGLPVVLCLRWIGATGIPRVVNDDAFGSALAAGHLLELGHRSVIEIAGPMDISTFAERHRGFDEVVAGAPYPVRSRTLTTATPTIEEGQRVIRELLSGGEDLEATAVFAHNDLLAVGAITELHARGIDCPEDVSVVGYNDAPLTEHLKPALTTIRLEIARMGRAAARAVVATIGASGERVSDPPIRPALIVRESTAAPRSAASV